MFSSLSDQHFYSLTTKGLPHIMICGLYLWEHDLVQSNGGIHTYAFDPSCYHAFQHRHYKSIQKTFDDVYLQEVELHVNIACEGHVCQDLAVDGKGDTCTALDDLFFDALDTEEANDYSDDLFFLWCQGLRL